MVNFFDYGILFNETQGITLSNIRPVFLVYAR